MKVTEKKQRRKDYSEEEKKFQIAQSHWEEFQDKDSWDKMFHYIHLATFNSVNKKLEGKIEFEEIEQRALDVTLNIMNGIKRKKENGIDWKIKKLSSFVHLPVLSIYSEKLKFEDKIKGEDAFKKIDSDGNECFNESFDSYSKNGIFHLHGKCENENDISETLSEKALIETALENCSDLMRVLSQRLRIFRAENPISKTQKENLSELKSVFVNAQLSLNTLRYGLFLDSELETLTEKRLSLWLENLNK